ncbi:MAG TPA: YceD family protein [Candidatus Limnocylindrales bacterium]|nr:YceD family protein [Candidatus Limnocylindrales bacterium]
MTVAAPLTYPLAGLLAEPYGSTRRYEVHGVTLRLPDDLRLASPVEGRVDVARTNRGVLVRANLRTTIEGSCSRCLRDIEVPIDVALDEEVLPSVDLATGLPVDSSAEPDVARLSDHHELELGPLVAEAISLAEPIAPLCEALCPGLCPDCGERLGPGHPAHPNDEIDPRLEALRGFPVDDDGGTG